MAKEGKRDFNHYWRTLRQYGVINEKFEGHELVQKGKKFVVLDYEQKLMEFNIKNFVQKFWNIWMLKKRP